MITGKLRGSVPSRTVTTADGGQLVYDAPPNPLPAGVVQAAQIQLLGATEVTVPITQTQPGSCLIVVVATANATTNATVASVVADGEADNFGALWSTGSTTGGAGAILSWWADPDCAGNQTQVTVTTEGGAGAAEVTVTVIEAQGLALTVGGLLDKSAGASGGPGTSWSSGATAETTQASELWIGAAASYLQPNQIGGPGEPWTTYDNPIETTVAVGYQVVSAEGAAQFAGTLQQSAAWTAGVVTLKPATPGNLIHAVSGSALTDLLGNEIPVGTVINADSFVFDPSGWFFYDGTPADGNAPVTWITDPGTGEDPFGNSLPFSGGVTTLDPSNGALAQLYDGKVLLTSTGNHGQAIQVFTTATVTGQAGAVTVTEAVDPSALATKVETLAPNGTNTPGVNIYGFESSIVTPVTVGVAGEMVYLIPGNTPALETWHDLGNAGIGMSGVQRYRMTVQNELQLDIRGTINSQASGATITWPNALPAGYVPSNVPTDPLGPVAMNGSGPNGRVYLNGSSQVVMAGFNGTTSIGCVLKIPLD